MLSKMLRASSGFPSFSYRNAYGSASNLTTYTFSNSDIGDPSPDRYIVVYGSAYTGSGGTTRSVSSVTIGGVTANLDYSSGAVALPTFFAKALVPTGTTGNVVVTFSAGVVNCAIAVYAVYGLKSTTAVDSDAGTLASGASLTLDTEQGGMIFGGCNLFSSTAGSVTGLTLDFDVTTDSGQKIYGGSAKTTANSTTVTFNLTGSARRYAAVSYY
jgi:hypothetical protein